MSFKKNFFVSVLLIFATLEGFFFQDLVSVDVEISQVKGFDTFTNCYQDDSRSIRYVHNPIFCRLLDDSFPLKL